MFVPYINIYIYYVAHIICTYTVYICRYVERETPKRFKRNLTFARILLFYLGAAVCATLIDCQTNPSGTHTLADLNRGQQLPIAIWLWVKCLGIPELDGSLNIIKYWMCFRSSSVEGPIRV